MAKRGVSITQFLVDGEPTGTVCAYMSNWTGQAIRIPRNLLRQAKDRPEINRPGVYFLFGYDDDDPEQPLVYVGETDNLVGRLFQHAADDQKAFWNVVVAFSSKDDNLTKAHVKFLEHRLSEVARTSVTYRCTNKNDPTKPLLPEAAVADMETYLDNLRIVLPTLGYSLLEESTTKVKQSKELAGTYFMKQAGVDAQAEMTAGGLTVKTGSRGNLQVRDTMPTGYRRLRKRLTESNVIAEQEKSIIFSVDYEFSSPSAAASILVGYPMNGRISWADKNGRTLKEIEEKTYSPKGKGQTPVV